jgi:vacuolar-type H+-ATPase subunit E/Vma4
MPLEAILKSIEERLNTDRQKIADEYARKIEEIEKQAASELQRIESEYRERTEREIRTLETREISAAEIEAKRIIRDRKAELIQEKMEEAFELLESLPDDREYREIIEKMASVAKNLLGRNCTVIVKSRDAPLLKDMKSIKIVEQDIDPFGGMLCISSDGKREVDLTISTLKKELRDVIALKLSDYMG